MDFSSFATVRDFASRDALMGFSAVSLFVVIATFLKKEVGDRRTGLSLPPVVHIPESELYSRPQKALTQAIRDNGSVIGIQRKGLVGVEYLASPEHTKQIFGDNRVLSFEHGVATILNMKFLLWMRGGRYFRDMDKAASVGMVPRIEHLTPHLFPIFMKQTKRLVEKGSTSDFFAHTRTTIAEAMLTIIMGEKYATLRYIAITEQLAQDMATVTGIYQNTSYLGKAFPRLWSMALWTRAILVSIVYKFFFILSPHIWREIRGGVFTPLEKVQTEYGGDEPLVHFMARMFARKDGTVSILDTIWIHLIVLSLIFASVHQTAVVAVWVMFELAARPSYIPAIRGELFSVAEPSGDGSIQLSYDSLRRARHLDSFIREVMRLKGDTMSTTRLALEDVPMGGYVIPKGHLVYPLACMSHRSREYHGDDADSFNGFRWVEQGQPAVMASPGYFPFGLGRWACPGRTLAVAEIKMIVLAVLALSEPRLKDGAYTVVDPLNATSVAPVGTIHFNALRDNSEAAGLS